jgi:hypothetical protein
VTAIITSLLGGGWELVAGWVLPTALNSVLFGVLVLPAFRRVSGLGPIAMASNPEKALALLAGAVIGGLVLSALQTPLYRVLEGYRGMPARLRHWRTQRHIRRKHLLEKRLRVARLSFRETKGSLRPGEAAELARLRKDPVLSKVPETTGKLSPVTISVLAEKYRRYPVDDGQVLPTRLGNAIRRFEEYGYDRYRLDGVTMWNALVGVVPDGVRKRVDSSRVGVDFFVCLLYGQFILALCGVAALITAPGDRAGAIMAIAVPLVLIPVWYRLAVEATDEWAAAFRGLVDIGRRPLADALGLALPATLEQERRMWQLASRFSRRPYSATDAELDQFRVSACAGPRQLGRRWAVPPPRGGNRRPRGPLGPVP